MGCMAARYGTMNLGYIVGLYAASSRDLPHCGYNTETGRNAFRSGNAVVETSLTRRETHLLILKGG